MERLIFVPIENLPERYSGQWFDWFFKAFAKRMDEKNYELVVVGDQGEKKITSGQFLDTIETNIYKSEQTASILRELQRD